MTSWERWLPGLHAIKRYDAAWLAHDVIAGLVLTTILVPVGIAYAIASGVPGIHGLYATIVPLLAYALFGPSRILVLGPDSSLAPVILAVVLPLSNGDPNRAVTIASLMAVVSGLVCIAIGLMRLGFVTDLLSKPIRYGYMNGIAFTVLIGQLPKMFGFSIDSGGPLRSLVDIASAITSGELNWVAFAGRHRDSGGHPDAEAVQTGAGRPGCRRRGDRRRGRLRPRRHGGRQGAWPAAAGAAVVFAALG